MLCSANQVGPAVIEHTKLSRIGSLSQVSGVLGCQWGDEGKGKLVDILANHFHIVARCQVYFYLALIFFFGLYLGIFTLYLCDQVYLWIRC